MKVVATLLAESHDPPSRPPLNPKPQTLNPTNPEAKDNAIGPLRIHAARGHEDRHCGVQGLPKS